jgi:signal transduction histidine kinase
MKLELSLPQVLSQNNQEKLILPILGLGLCYCIYFDSMITAIVAFSLLISGIICGILSLVFKKKIKLKYFIIISAAITLCLSWQTAGHAFILEEVEDALIESLSVTGDGVEEDVITAFFTLIRVIVVFGLLGMVVVIIVKNNQGDDVKDLISMFVKIVLVLVGIQMISNVILGE